MKLPRRTWRRTTERATDAVDVSARVAPYAASPRPSGWLRSALSRVAARPLPFGAGREAGDVVGRLRPVALADAVASSGPATGSSMPSARRRLPRRHVRRVAIGTSFALLVGATGALPAAALTVGPGTVAGFEIDGDFDVDNANRIDWESVEPTIVLDDTIDSAFQGSSKEEDPANWVCQAHAGGVTPGKDNLLRAYVDARFEGDEAFLDLGLIRAEGEGDTHVNFEFNQSGTPEAPGEYQDGPCGIDRTEGDLLVAVDFGGTSFLTAEVRLFTWDDTNSEWDEITGFTAAAANNTVDIADDPLMPGIQEVEARTFVEVSINLPDDFLTCPGFAITNIRSRSSHSIISALQDKMPSTAVDVSSCGKILLHKVDDLGQPLAGAVFGLFDNAAATGDPIATCTSDADGDCSFDEVTPGTYWIREVSAPSGFNPDPDIVEVTVGFREEVEITEPFVNPLILGAIRIVKTHSLGGPVAGVRFVLLSGGSPATDRDGDPAECTTGTDGTCEIDRLVPGVYTVHEDPSTVPSTMTPAPDQTVTVVGNQTVQVAFVNPVKPLAIQIVKTVNDQDSIIVHEGDALTYKLVITNTGQQTLTLTSLTDVANLIPVDLPAGCDNLVNSTPFAPGATRSCTYTDTAGEDDVDNVATVVGKDAFDRTATDDDDAHVNVIHPEIELTKTVNGAASVTVHDGDTLTYVVTFTNTGDTALRITSLTDTVNGTLSTLSPDCAALVNDTWLAPGASRSCTYTDTAPAGGQTNTARVVGVDVLGGEVDADDTAVARVINPDISLVKTVNGEESVTVHQGDTLNYVITFTNNGDTPLVITSLTDVANGSAIDLPAECDGLVNSTPLAVGGSRTCSYTAAAGAGDVTNVATVTGEDELGEDVSASDDAVVDVIHPAISIVKTVNDVNSVTAHAGDTVTYKLVITNTGDTPLTITALTDRIVGGAAVDLPAGCDDLVGDRLAAGASVSCTYTGTAPANDIENLAEVTGVDDVGGDKGTVKDDDNAFVDVINPAITIVKTVNGDDEVTVHEGDLLTYRLVITNTGDTPLTITSLADVANGTGVTLPAGCTGLVSTTPLAPTASRDCMYTATATAADVHNVATVTGEDSLGEEVDDSDDADVVVISPAISIVKTVNGEESVTVHAGDELEYELVITNTGDTPLEITSLTDVANGLTVNLPADCSGLVGTTLGVGDDFTCTYTTTATAADVDNVATVTGEDDLGKDVSDDDDASVDVINPAITIVKTVNGEESVTVHAGDDLTYLLVITNTGDTPLTITSLEDVANGDDVDLPAVCDGLVGDTLAAGASVTCTYTTVATAEDVENVATVTGEDDLGKEVDDEDDADVDVINPAITIVKTVNDEDAVTVHAGDALTYELVITNTGDTPLTLTSLADVANGTAVTLPAGCTSLVGQVLAAGASVTCSYTTVATTEDVDNVATVTGEDELDEEVDDEDDAEVDVINPAITIVKTANPTTISGTSGTTTFSYLVTNTGDTPLVNVKVTDDILGDIGTVDRLEPGASVTLTKTANVSQAQPRNVGTVEGTDELGKKVTDDDDENLTFVLPVTEERPAPTPEPPAPAPVPLPRTGGWIAIQVGAGLALMIIGGLALQPARRRKLVDGTEGIA